MAGTAEQDEWVERVLGIRLGAAAEDPEEALPMEQRIESRAKRQDVAEVATRVLDKARKAEPVLTKAIEGTTATLGGRMIGLDYRIKSADSLARKIATDVVKTGLTPDEAASGIADAVRYTSCFEPDRYTPGTEAVLQDLQGKRNAIRKLKNTWLKSIPYKGINVQLLDPDRQPFELQFHTPDSFRAKDQDTHHIYEEMRLLDSGSARWKELNAQQLEIFARLPVPPDVERIKDV